jgi:cell wall-associated NlpC family hydrolase
MSRHLLCGDPRMREVAVPVATVWTSPEAPRDLDAHAVADLPDADAWTRVLDAEGTADRRIGLHGRTLTQLLLGEPALVLEERDGWSRVAALWQRSSAHETGYPGWVRTAHLDTPVDRVDGPTAYVTAPSATCTVDTGQVLALSFGTALWAGDGPADPGADGEVTVLLPGGRRGTVARADVHRSDKAEQPRLDPDDLLATARRFLGLRYLWGGTSAWGLDCSGLVHLSLRAHGVLLPRDAFDQAADDHHLEPVPLDGVQPGDLYFFARPGERVYHVGFATSPVEADGTRRMLHAPEGGAAAIEDAPMAADRVEKLVAAARVVPTSSA